MQADRLHQRWGREIASEARASAACSRRAASPGVPCAAPRLARSRPGRQAPRHRGREHVDDGQQVRSGVRQDSPASPCRLTRLNITLGQQCCAFHAIWIAAAGREPAITQPSPASERRSGLRIVSRRSRSPAAPRNTSTTARRRAQVRPQEVLHAAGAPGAGRGHRQPAEQHQRDVGGDRDVQALSGTISSSVAPDQASASPRRRSSCQPIAAISGARATQAAQHEPVPGDGVEHREPPADHWRVVVKTPVGFRPHIRNRPRRW